MKRAQDIELFEGKKNALTIDTAVCDYPSCKFVIVIGTTEYVAQLTDGAGIVELGGIPAGLSSAMYFLELDDRSSAVAYGGATLIQVEGAGGDCPPVPDVNGKITEHNADDTAHDGAEAKLSLLKNNLALLPSELPDTQSVSTLTTAYNLLVNAVRNAVAAVVLLFCLGAYAAPVRFGSLIATDMLETNGTPVSVVAQMIADAGSGTAFTGPYVSSFNGSTGAVTFAEADTLASVAARGGFAGTETLNTRRIFCSEGTRKALLSGDGLTLGYPETGFDCAITTLDGLFMGFDTYAYIWAIHTDTFSYTEAEQTANWSFARPTGNYTVAATSDLTAFATKADLTGKVSVTNGTASGLTITNPIFVGTATLNGTNMSAGASCCDSVGVGYMFSTRNNSLGGNVAMYQAWSTATSTNDYLIVAGSVPTHAYLRCRLFYAVGVDIASTNPVTILAGWGGVQIAPSGVNLFTVATNQMWYAASTPSPNKYIDFVIPPKPVAETSPVWLWIYAIKPYQQGVFAATGIRIRKATATEVTEYGY